MKESVLLFTILFSLCCSFANAQTSQAQQRDRDIRIAESILSEIFSTENSDIAIAGFQQRNVHGEYVPGYGVHFTVSPGRSGIVHLAKSMSDDERVVVELSQIGDSDSESSKHDDVREKIYEYMKNYAPLISGVPDDESIRVTYALNNRNDVTWVFYQNGQHNRELVPGVSIWADVSYLKQFRNGRISEQELMNRINTHTLSSDEKYTDFNVFATVLETALNDADAEHLRVSRKPQMEYLPGLGVRYRVQVSTRPSFFLNEFKIFDNNFEFKMDSLQMNLNESLEMIEESLSPLADHLDSVNWHNLTEEEREEMRQRMSEQRQKIRAQQDSLRSAFRNSSYSYRVKSDDSLDLSAEADVIMNQLLEVMQNYGSTLTSLRDEEMLMISINWTSRDDDLPERTEVRIRKSDMLRGEEPNIEEIERR